MDRSRLTGSLVPIVLLAFSGAAAAVNVLPEQQSTGLTQKALKVTQEVTMKQLAADIGIQPRSAAAKLVMTDEEREQISAKNAEAKPGAPKLMGVVKSANVSFDLSKLDVAAMNDQTYSFGNAHVRRTAGKVVLAFLVDAEGASGARILLDKIKLPAGAKIYVSDEAGKYVHEYDGSSPQFWTNTIEGSRIIVQVEQPEDAAFSASLQISGVALLDTTGDSYCPVNAPCVEDGSCHDETEWSTIDQARKAIALMNFIVDGEVYMCSGGLLADTDGASTVPYFLTANHCVSTRDEAASVETWFDFRTSSCNGVCPTGPGLHSTLGATLLSASAVDDHSLMVLEEMPPADAWYLGWTDKVVAWDNGTKMYRISHPSGSPQAYTVEKIDASDVAATMCPSDTMPRGPFIFSRDVVGATEGGSSGSPVMLESGQVVGQLYGACGSNVWDVCDAENNVVVDGAFANYYSKVSKWLNPSSDALPLTVQLFGDGVGRVTSSDVILEASTTKAASAQSTNGVAAKLYGGVAVEKTDWPWQAALKVSTWSVNDAWTCGGSVIDSKWILTAAHCVVDSVDSRYVTVSPGNITVRTGSNRFEYGGQESRVKRIVKHPDFDPTTRDNDLALLELLSDVYVEDPIRPVTLERESTLACLGTLGTVTGWTATTVCGNLATVLSKVEATLVNPSVCQTAYGTDNITSNMLCTSTVSNGSTDCQADDGSPLAVSNGRGGYVQAGIVSRGNECTSTSGPTVYTRLANYVGWMEKMTRLDLSSDAGPGVIDCGSTCEAAYSSGDVITLTATPAAGSVFAGWSGACGGTETTCDVSMTQARNVRATFDSIDGTTNKICY